MIQRILRRKAKFWNLAFVFLGIYLLSTTLFYYYSSRGLENEAEIDDVFLTSPFVKDEPKLVILLSYQRSGSSFVGEWFNMNPEVFFSFEPVDSLYSAMYGTPQNSNVPSDITNYPNGSIRKLPDEEMNSVSNFLRKLLLCDFDNLPTQALMNFYFIKSYQQFSAATDYTRCLRRLFETTFRQCEPFVTNFCGSRFGEAKESNQKECFRRLWLNQEIHSPYQNDKDIELNFTKHLSCLKHQRTLLKTKCQHFLLDICINHQIRVIKTVRVTMESVEPLLKVLPNFRVIHLVRDPHAVALSRKLFDGNVLGIYSGNDTDTIAKEAKLYCSTAVRDIKASRRLAIEFPGKIYTLWYEELIANTTLYLDKVYRFLGARPPYSVVKWLSLLGKLNLGSNKTLEEIAQRWQHVISIHTEEKILESCKEFYQLIRYK